MLFIYRAVFALSLTLLLCLALCPMMSAAPGSTNKKAQTGVAPSPFHVTTTSPTFSLPDPKLPGKLLYYLRAITADGQFEADGFHGSLTKVWARLYQKGVPAAVLSAPRAQGGSANKSVVITGLGGVVVKSLLQPGTILTADTVVWYANLNKVVASGHVFYHDGKTGLIYQGPWLKTDTKLKSVQTGSGQMSGIF